jgi:hypothetical protein
MAGGPPISGNRGSRFAFGEKYPNGKTGAGLVDQKEHVRNRELDSRSIGNGTSQHGLKSNQPFRQRQKPPGCPTAESAIEEVFPDMKNAKYRGLTLSAVIYSGGSYVDAPG